MALESSLDEEKNKLNSQEKESLHDLLDWLKRQGGNFHHHVYFAKDDVMGISGYAAEDIDPNKVIVTVPINACITTSQAERRIKGLLLLPKIADKSSLLASELNSKDWIVLYLVLHRIIFNLDEKSARNSEIDGLEPSKKRRKTDNDEMKAFLHHQQYVKLLPNSVFTPTHFNLPELLLLRNTPLFTHAIRRRAESRERCKVVSKYIIQTLDQAPNDETWIRSLINLIKIPKAFWDLAEKPVEEYTEERRKWKLETGESFLWDEDEEIWPLLKIWRWAETAHGSRAFPPHLLHATDSAPVLLPCYDLFNHARHAKVSWTFIQRDSDNSVDQDCVTLTLHNPVEKDHQIFNSYGPKSNESLLASYGFVNETMEDDTVTMKLGRSNQIKLQKDNHHSTKNENLEDQHYWQYGQPCPPLLLQQVIESIKKATENDEENENDQDLSHLSEEKQGLLKDLMMKGEALELIGEMASNKLKGLDNVNLEKDIFDEKVRRDVGRNISIYRKGQIRVLQWAIEESEREEEEVMRQIDELMQEAG